MLSESFAVLFFLKAPKKDLGQPRAIYIRITVDGIAKEASIQRKCLPKQWHQQLGRSLGKDELSLTLNTFLTTLEAKLEKKRTDLISADKQVTAEILIDYVKGRDTPKYYLLEEFKKHNDQLTILGEKGKTAAGTCERYSTAYSHTRDYIQWKYAKEDLLLADLDYDFVNDFYFYLMSVRSCCNNTACKYVSNMKKIVLIAVKKKYILSNPFAEFAMHLDDVEHDALNEGELYKIVNHNYEIDRLDRIRDVFLFSCMTGLAFADVEKLSMSDIEIDETGSWWIIQDRTKTKRKADIPLFRDAQSIIEKYANHECLKKGVLLPVVANANYNLYLKEIAAGARIVKRLTTHTARRTFASLCLNNGVELKVISKMLGHKSVKQTEKYLRLEKDHIRNSMNKLKKILDGKELSFTQAIRNTFTPAVKNRVLELAEIKERLIKDHTVYG